MLRPLGESEELAAALISSSWVIAFSDLVAALDRLDEAGIIAADLDADTLVNMALSYRANHLALHGRIDEASEHANGWARDSTDATTTLPPSCTAA